MTDYAKRRQRIKNDLLQRSDVKGREVICSKTAALILGYTDVRRAKEVLEELPSYRVGKKPKFSIGDISSYLARRAEQKQEG